MRKRSLPIALILVLGLCVASVGVTATQPDEVATRQALMDASAAAAGLSAAMLKKEMPYNRDAAKSAITTLWAASVAMGPLFAKESAGGDSSASPKIWSDHAGFEHELQSYMADTRAAVKASGKDGPADLAAFKSAVTPVLKHCRACHQDYRIKH